MWTSEMHQKLVDLAPTHTARQIADEIGGVTRNAVLGRAHRNGVALKSEEGKRRGFSSGQRPKVTGGRKGKFLPADHPCCKSRPRGAHAFSLEQRAGAVAARMAGASLNRSAKMVGAGFQILRQKWMHDPVVVERAKEILLQARADATREKEMRLSLLRARTAAVKAHNTSVLSGWGDRNRIWVERKLEGESLSSIAADYGVTRERVRQVLMRAVAQGLKSPPDINLLRDRVAA